MIRVLSLFVLSLLIVSLGQPQMSPILSLLASGGGFALFWISMRGVKKRFLYSAFWFFLVQLVQLSWLASPTYQGIYILFVYVGLSLGLAIQFGVLALFIPKTSSFTFRRCLGIAGLWTLMEWSRLYFLSGFTWNPVGLAHSAYPVGMQMAAIWGVFGLSFWVMFVNLLAVKAFLERRKKALFAWGGFLILPYLFGIFHIQYHDGKNTHDSDPFRVALVQTALLPDQKVYFHQSREQFVSPYRQWMNILLYLDQNRDQKGSKDLDLIVLPEAALPFGAYVPVYKYNEMKKIAESVWGEVDLGALLVEPLIEKRGGEIYVSNAFWAQAIADHYGAELVIGLDDSDGDHNYNAAFHFVPHKINVSRYEKRVLLPLAEYLPLSILKPLVARYGINNFFTPGKGAKVIEGKCPLTISICYEECFSHMMREGRTKGAKLFVNVTNDAWYPFSRLPQQHFDHGRLRAIENGVPLVRACNTGMTVGVDSLGRTIDRFGNANGNFELERGALFLQVDLYSFSTLYTVWGDAFILSLSLICLPFLIRKRKSP